MASAQDQALAELIAARGLLEAEALARARASGQPLPQALISARSLRPEAVSGLLRELTRTGFACRTCGMRFSYDSLSRLPSLSCPGCSGSISAMAPTSGSLPAVRPVPQQQLRQLPPSGSSFPAAGPTGTVRASGGGSIRLGNSPSSVGPISGPPVPGAPGDTPSTLGPYTLIRQLGRGSYGAVFLAKKQGLERQFALKLLLDSEFADHETIARFELEAKVASKINDPGVLGVYDVGRDGDHLYYVMEYCEGEDLKERLREGRLDPRQAAKLVRRLGKTLVATHAHGVIHRDLKPSNIILDSSSGRPRVTDFGLARDHSLLQSMTQSGDVLGTPHYMSPEQFRGERDLDHRIDVYALGVILYECLTGERPFIGSTPVELSESVCAGDVRDPTSIVPEIPRRLSAICLKAMHVRADQRYPTAEALVSDLERFLRGEAPQVTEGKRGLKLVAAAVGLLLFTATALGLAVAFSRSSPTASTDPQRDPARARVLLVKARALRDADGPTPEVRAQLDEARGLTADGSKLRSQVDAELLIQDAWEALASVRAEARKRGPYDPLAARLDDARTRLGERAPKLSVELLLEAARLANRRGRPRAAGSAADAVPPGSGEGSLEARRLRALSLELSGEEGGALTQYRTLSELDPEGAHGLCAAAAIKRIHGGEGREAVALAERALQIKPSWSPALIELGYSRLDADDLDGATEALDEAKERAPDDPRVLVGLGLLRLREDKPGSAKRALEGALELYADAPAPGARILFALTLLRLDETEEATQALDAVLDRDPGSLDALVHRGAIHYARGNQVATEADWKRAYEANAMRGQELLTRWHGDDVVEAFSSVGAGQVQEERDPAFFQLGNIREAVIRHHHSQRLEALGIPSFVREDVLTALVRAAKGVPWGDDIGSPLRRGLRVVPKSAEANTERLRILAARDRTEEAFAALQKIRRLGGVDAALDRELRLIAADLSWRAGKLGEALDSFNALGARDTTGTVGRVARAQGAWLLGDYEHVLELCRRVLSKEPQNTDALTFKTMALIALGKPREALDSLRQVYSRVGALDSRVLAARTALLLEFRRAEQGSTLFEMAAEIQAYTSVPEHLQVCPGFFDDRLAAELALASPSRALNEWAHEGLPNLLRDDPRNPHTLLLCGYSAVLQNQAAEAASSWTQARELDPSLPIPDVYLERFVHAGGSEAQASAFRARKR